MTSLCLWFQALLFYPMFLVYTKQVPIYTAQFKFRGQIMCVFCMFELCYNMCSSTPLWISENIGRVRWALRLVVRKVWQGRLQASVGCLLHVVSSDIVVLLRSYTDYSLKIWQYSPKIARPTWYCKWITIESIAYQVTVKSRRILPLYHLV